MKKRVYYISLLTCPDCGKQFPIPRAAGRLRKPGHIKDLWCPFCKRTTKMIEGGLYGRKTVRQR